MNSMNDLPGFPWFEVRAPGHRLLEAAKAGDIGAIRAAIAEGVSDEELCRAADAAPPGIAIAYLDETLVNSTDLLRGTYELKIRGDGAPEWPPARAKAEDWRVQNLEIIDDGRLRFCSTVTKFTAWPRSSGWVKRNIYPIFEPFEIQEINWFADLTSPKFEGWPWW